MLRIRMERLTAMGVAALATATATGQVTTFSTGNGDWNSPATWTNGVPGPLDTAVINAGDTVWLATNGVPSNPSVTVDRIDVLGTLLSDNIQGQSMRLLVEDLNVLPGGVVSAQNGGAAPGGTLSIEPAVPGLPLNVSNDGLIRAGDGNCGGNLLIYGNAPGSDLAAPNTTITSNGGSFLAGVSGASVWMAAGNVTLNNATVQAGDVTPAAPNCGRGGLFGTPIAGAIYISSINSNFNGTTSVTAGSNTAGTGVGGTVFLRSLNNLFIDGPASVLAGGPGGAGCPGVLTFAGGTSTILGTVSPGTGVGCYVWDPPTLVAADDLDIDAAQVIIGGETFDATGLNAASAPHITATDFIEINLSPGGFMDTTGLTPGVNYFDTPLIVVNGDVRNADGLGLGRFTDADIEFGEANVWRDVALSPGGSFYGVPGGTVRIPVQSVNVGAQAETVLLEVTDTMGWVDPPVGTVRSLPVGFSIYEIVEVEIPLQAQPGDVTVVRSYTETNDGVEIDERFTTVEVLQGNAGGPCNPADLAEPFGVLDLNDVNAFVEGFLSGDPDLGDLNGDGVLDLGDVGLFIESFFGGCP
jgi:hypothetical protein